MNPIFKFAFSLICFFTVQFPLGLFSQTINISIHQEFLKQGKKHGIFISDNDGALYFSEILSSDEVYKDYNFNINKEKGEKLNLTIFSQHYGEEKKYGKEHFYAYTYLNINDSVFVKKPENTINPDFDTQSTKLIEFKITGVTKVHEVFTDTPRLYGSLRYKVRKDGLRVELQKVGETDLYMLFKANHEDFYRYLYVSNGDSIPAVINYDDLPTDVVIKEINLPEYADWAGSIKAINANSQNECYFFLDANNSKSQSIVVFLPQQYYFYDFQVFLQCFTDKVNYQYRAIGDRDRLTRYTLLTDTIPNQIEKFEDIYIREDYLDFGSFQFQLDGGDQFFLCETNIWPDAFASSIAWNEAYISKWYILGIANDLVAFKKPIFPEYFKSELKLLNNLSYYSPINIGVFKSLDQVGINFWNNPNKFIDLKWLMEHNIVGKIESIRFK